MTNHLLPDGEGLGSYSISHQDWSLHRKGLADQQRHKEKIKEVIDRRYRCCDYSPHWCSA